MNPLNSVVVAFRHQLASIQKDVQNQTEERLQRKEYFTRRLNDFATRYQAMVTSRIRRLSEEGICIDMDEIRDQIRREKAFSVKRDQQQTTGVTSKSVVYPTRRDAPQLTLELSFCSQNAKRAAALSVSSDDVPKEDKRKRKSSKRSLTSRRTFRDVSSTVINIQRLSHRRHTVLSVVPINLSRETEVPSALNAEHPDKCTKDHKFAHTTTGRHKSAHASLARGHDSARDADSGTAVNGKAKLKRAVRKLGTMRHFQNAF